MNAKETILDYMTRCQRTGGFASFTAGELAYRTKYAGSSVRRALKALLLEGKVVRRDAGSNTILWSLPKKQKRTK